MQKFIVLVTKEDLTPIMSQNFECFILSEALSDTFKKDFAKHAQLKDKIVLANSLKDCLDFNLDGVVLDLSKSQNIASDWKAIKPTLKGKFVGLITRNRRHEAMLISECEPDFIIFKVWKDGLQKTKELTSWYHEMFLIQSALFVQENIDYQSFETDFVIIPDTNL